MTNDSLAKLLGVSEPMVAYIRNGRRPPPLKRIEPLADALGLKGATRARFVFQAQLEHCPEPLRSAVVKMAEQSNNRNVRGLA